MSPPLNIIYFLCVILFTLANTSHSLHDKFQAFLPPIFKDNATNLYYSPVSLGVNVINQTYYQSNYVNLAIDLSGSAPLLLTCAAAANSRSYHPIKCGSSRCKQAKPDSFSCPNNSSKKATCHKSFSTSLADHPIIKARLLRDTVSMLYTYNGGTVMSGEIDVPMTIACTDADVKPLPSIAVGILGLAKTVMSLPPQAVSLYKLPLKVAMCLPSAYYPAGSGDLFIGGGPYFMTPYPKDVSTLFASTPLLATDPSRGDYIIDVQHIKIGGNLIPIEKKLGTKISTMDPYTVLHTSIYKALVSVFSKKAKMAKATAVKPFGSCFSSKGLGKTMMGSGVPVIELALGGGAKWRIYGSNSLVKVSKDVVCLGFVDAGVHLKTAMVIGGFQMEDTLVEFDLKASKFSFSSSLLLRNSSCSQSRIF